MDDNRRKLISDNTKKAMVEVTKRLNQEKIQFAKDNNLVKLNDILKIYGTGYIQSDSFDVEIIKFKACRFIKREDVFKFEQYSKLSRKEHTENTCLSRYGVKNPMQHTSIQNKVKATNLSKYGSENVFSNDDIKQKIKNTKLCCHGDANYNNRDLASKTMLSRYGERSFTMTDDFKQKVITNKQKLYRTTKAMSKAEAYIVKQLKDYCSSIIQNKKILGRFYLDIYLPKYNLAIEYNGNHFHSLERGLSPDYHLQKSLLCRDMKIRLIHIYEFEDLDTQIDLIIDLLQGKDRFPKDDFNKNNLLDNIPKPELIYKTNKYTIYGAGALKTDRKV